MSIPRFPNGSRVCFIGDSLVARNQYLPFIIDCYRKNFPGAGIRFFNCGVSGGTADFAVQSFDADVLPHNPTHVVVAFGVNDSGRTDLALPRSQQRYETFLRRYERYKRRLAELCARVTDSGIELILCTPAPYDEYTETASPALRGGAALLCEYAAYVRALAKEKGYRLVDFHRFLSHAIQLNETPIFAPDHVHPTLHGFYLMAEYFLAEQGLSATEETSVFPDHFTEWREKLLFYRSINAVECMIIGNYGMALEEKYETVRRFLAKKNWSDNYFEIICNRYLEAKPKEAELAREIDAIYERDILF
ncbi:MAG: SGNH/GDSL hydrolase family protein [Clostridia bacterium]|nr:SGNH/GDSL hydrolase family protein [Clostridia bacterium]